MAPLAPADPGLTTSLLGLNAEQQAAVQIVDRHLAVEAGAGTGKTRVLTRRFVSLVLDHGLAVREILALTFTKRAAAQMQGRVRKAFLERIAVESDEAIKRRAQQAVRDLDSAYISTIHSFGARVLREFALPARIDPHFRELDELEAQRLQYQLVDQLLAEWEADESATAMFETIFGSIRWALGERPEAGEFARRFLPLYAQVRSQTLGQLSIEGVAGPDDPPGLAEALSATHLAFADASLSAGKKYDSSSDWYAAAQQLWQNVAGAVAAHNDEEALGLLKELRQGAKDKRKASAALEPLRMHCSNVAYESIAPMVRHRRAAEHRRALAEALLRFHMAYTAAKDRLGMLDFTDLEHRTIALLRDIPWQRRLWRSRFRQVMVDEFQDTSPVQLELLKLLTGVGEPESEGPRPLLFVVGDPKQSIYGFRQADIIAYDHFLDHTLQVAESFSLEGGPGVAAGQRLRLKGNYRSRESVLSFVNATLMGRRREAERDADADELGRMLFSLEAALEAKGEFAGDGPPVPIELVTFDSTPEALEEALRGMPETRRWSKDEYEAHLLVAALKEIVESRCPITVDDHEGGRIERPLDWGDIACLVRATASFGPFERACKKFGVPYFVNDGKGFFAAREVRDVLQLLRLLANPSDDICCAGVLRGPLAGPSIEGLYALTQSQRFRPASADQDYATARDTTARRASLWEIVHQVETGRTGETLSAEDRAACVQFCNLAAELRARLTLEPLASVIEACYRATDLPQIALRQEDGLRRYANLRKLQELAAGYSVGEHGSLLQFVRAMEEYEVREARIGEAVVETPGGGAMVLLTIHAAKGEEYPFVVFPGLGRMHRGRTSFWGFDARYGLGIQVDLTGDAVYEPTVGLIAVKAQNKRAEEAEAHRLLYVALTRAKERLLLGGGGRIPNYVKRFNDPKRKEPFELSNCQSWLEELCFLYGIGDDCDGGRTYETHEVAASLQQRGTAQLLSTVHTVLREGVAAAHTVAASPSNELAEAWEAAKLRLMQRLPDPDPLAPCFQVSELIAYDRCPASHVYEFRWEMPSNQDVQALEIAAGKRLPQKLVGSAFHRLMERIDWSDGADLEAQVADLAQEIVAHMDFTPAEQPPAIEKLTAHAAAFFASDLFNAEIKPATTLWKELPLVWHMPQDPSDPHGRRVYFRGIADLVYQRPDGSWAILDYKTRVMDPEEAAIDEESDFGLQLACYAEALRRRFPTGTSPAVQTIVMSPTPTGTMLPRYIDASRYDLGSVVGKFVCDLRAMPAERIDLAAHDAMFILGTHCHRCGYHDLCPKYPAYAAST